MSEPTLQRLRREVIASAAVIAVVMLGAAVLHLSGWL